MEFKRAKADGVGAVRAVGFGGVARPLNTT